MLLRILIMFAMRGLLVKLLLEWLARQLLRVLCLSQLRRLKCVIVNV